MDRLLRRAASGTAEGREIDPGEVVAEAGGPDNGRDPGRLHLELQDGVGKPAHIRRLLARPLVAGNICPAASADANRPSRTSPSRASARRSTSWPPSTPVRSGDIRSAGRFSTGRSNSPKAYSQNAKSRPRYRRGTRRCAPTAK